MVDNTGKNSTKGKLRVREEKLRRMEFGEESEVLKNRPR